jgi:hypothetical protein
LDQPGEGKSDLPNTLDEPHDAISEGRDPLDEFRDVSDEV